MTTSAKTTSASLKTELVRLDTNTRTFSGLVESMSAMLDKAAAVCMFSIMALVVTNVISRGIFNKAILGTYEFVGFLTAIMIGFSLAHCAIKNAHIAVDFIVQSFPTRLQALADILTNSIGLLFWGMSAWQIAKYGYGLSLRGVVSPTTQVPFYYVIYLLAFGFFALSLVLGVRLAESIRKATN